MSKWISKKLHLDIMDFKCNKFILMTLWVKVFVSQEWVHAEITLN